MKWEFALDFVGTVQWNQIPLLTYAIWMSQIASSTNPFSKYHVDEKSFESLSFAYHYIHYLSMEFEPELYLWVIFSFHWSLFLISAYRFRSNLLVFSFFYLFCIFAHLGFTYTRYITVKSSFFWLRRLQTWKKHWVAPYIWKSIQ